MIILRYPKSKSENVKYSVIKKPRFEDALKSALLQAYTENLALKNAQIISDFLIKYMPFPKDGIYYVDSETIHLLCYSTKQNCWVDTEKTFETYILSKNSVIWNKFFEMNKFLISERELIQNVVEVESNKMFETDDWRVPAVIELSNYMVYDMTEYNFILDCLKMYFSEKKAYEIYIKIKGLLFNTTDKNFVCVTKDKRLEFAFFEDKILKCGNYNRVKEELSCVLDPESLGTFMIQLVNWINFGSTYDRFRIISREKNGILRVDYGSSVPVYIIGEKVYCQATENVLKQLGNEIIDNICHDQFGSMNISDHDKPQKISAIDASIPVKAKAVCDEWIFFISLIREDSSEDYLFVKRVKVHLKDHSTFEFQNEQDRENAEKSKEDFKRVLAKQANKKLLLEIQI